MCASNHRQGGWWRSPEKDHNWFFELRLDDCPMDALELITTIGTDQNNYRVGTRFPLPFYDEVSSFSTVKYLRLLAPHYEVRRNKYVLSRTSDHSDPGIKEESSNLRWVLIPLYRVSFHINGIKRCTKETNTNNTINTCFVVVAEGYRIRAEREIGGRDDPVSIATEEPLRIPFDIAWGLNILPIILLGWLLYYTECRRKDTFRRLEDTNQKLDRSNQKLERAYNVIAQYFSVFQHETTRILERIHRSLSSVSKGDEIDLESIKKSVEDIKDRLRFSSRWMRYDEHVRTQID